MISAFALACAAAPVGPSLPVVPAPAPADERWTEDRRYRLEVLALADDHTVVRLWDAAGAPVPEARLAFVVDGEAWAVSRRPDGTVRAEGANPTHTVIRVAIHAEPGLDRVALSRPSGR